jgi:hypothetical protein
VTDRLRLLTQGLNFASHFASHTLHVFLSSVRSHLLTPLEQDLLDVAANACQCLGHLDPGQISELPGGLLQLALRHHTNNVRDNLPGSPINEPGIIKLLQIETKIAWSAYSIPDASQVETHSGGRIRASELLRMHSNDKVEVFRPAYFVALDNEMQALRVVVRGTSGVNDVLTNLAGHSRPYGNGHAHFGMLRAAEWLLDDLSAFDLPWRKPGCALICEILFMHLLLHLLS